MRTQRGDGFLLAGLAPETIAEIGSTRVALATAIISQTGSRAVSKSLRPPVSEIAPAGSSSRAE
jgi:hypothetical protein